MNKQISASQSLNSNKTTVIIINNENIKMLRSQSLRINSKAYEVKLALLNKLSRITEQEEVIQ